VHLSPHEVDRLLVASAADLARRRLSRGARLGSTEATALIVDEIHEMAWDGLELEEVIHRAKRLLSEQQVLPGVPRMVSHLQVDALFPAGSFLVDVDNPIPGATDPLSGDGPPRKLNVGRPRRDVSVLNEATYTVRVTSHVDFSQVNPLLRVDDDAVGGWRLDIPAGSSVAWAPGERRVVTLVTWNPSSEEGDRHGHA
jgi:urease subunit gamma/beta